MKLYIAIVLASSLAAVGCGKGGPSSSGSSTAKASASSKASAAPSGSASAKKDDGGKSDTGEKGALKKLTTILMNALKKKDFAAAAKLVDESEQKEAEKAFEKMFEKKKWRHDAIQAWDGKAGKVRVDGDKARVKIGEKGDEVWVVQLKKTGDKWVVSDLKSPDKKDWKKWGKEL